MKRFSFVVFVCLLLLLSSCSVKKCDIPYGIEVDDDNKLVWKEIVTAKAYNVSFLNIDTNEEVIEVTRKTNFNLNELEVGRYEIKVQAISGSKNYRDSAYSSVIEFRKYLETGCVYTLINNNTEYEITKVGRATGEFVIEDYYRDKAVTRIAEGAFKNSSKVTGIVVGNNIISIGDNAFYNCSKLEYINLPNSIETLGVGCFQSCRSLNKIVLPKYLEVVPYYCFAYCRGLTEVVLNERLVEIAECGFSDCSALEEIVIPESVKVLGNSSFMGCLMLKNVTIGSNVTSLGNEVFHNTGVVNVTFLGNKVESIGNLCFLDCHDLNSIVLPDGVKSIGNNCFARCEKLIDIKIPSSAESLGAGCFVDTALFKAAIDNKNLYVYADKWLVGYNGLLSLTLEEINESTLRDDTIGIADKVFMNLPELKIVTLPKSVKYIGRECFRECPKLWKFLSLDDSVKVIGVGAFYSCSLNNVQLGDGLEVIGAQAFDGNIQLDNSSLDPKGWIPESVKEIGNKAFANTLLATKPVNGVIYAANWVVGVEDGVGGSVVLEFDTDKVCGIANYAFMNAAGIDSIQGISNCRYIGTGAFYGCEKLASVSLNRNIEEIRDYTFMGCKSLFKVTLPRTLKTIGDYAFCYCEILEEIDLESTNLKSIGDFAFYGNHGIKDIVFPKTLEEIGGRAFYACKELNSIVLKENVKTIGDKAFMECSSLTDVDLGSVEVIGNNAFEYTRIGKIVIPSSVKVIGNKAFFKCSYLTHVTFNEGLEEIGAYCFYEDDHLVDVKLPSTLKNIRSFAFYNNVKFTSLYLPKSVEEIGQHAFNRCINLTIYTDADSINPLWHERFNSSFRPVFYGCEVNENKEIVSVMIGVDYFINPNALGGVNGPIVDGKTFIGFKAGDGTVYKIEDLLKNDKEGKYIPVYE